MSPSKREREYAKRRYDDWQDRVAKRQEQARTARRNALAAVGAVAAVLAVVGAVAFFANRDTGSATASAAPSGSATSAQPAGTGSAATPGPNGSGAAAAANNPCAVPAARASTSPKSWPNAPDASLAAGKSWDLALDTTCGPIAITLDGAKAPKAVASTIFLARNGFWDNTRCHRLTTTGIYVLQCGDPTGTGTGGPGYSYGPVENAPADNVYPAGTVAMARQGENGTSMGSQFFLVYKDSTIPSDSAGGYTVLGKIVGGLDVVEKVAAGGISTTAPPAPARAVSITSTMVNSG